MGKNAKLIINPKYRDCYNKCIQEEEPSISECKKQCPTNCDQIVNTKAYLIAVENIALCKKKCQVLPKCKKGCESNCTSELEITKVLNIGQEAIKEEDIEELEGTIFKILDPDCFAPCNATCVRYLQT